ncbi:hypothetical protein Anas_05332, partial [Armadillidium nasatum]
MFLKRRKLFQCESGGKASTTTISDSSSTSILASKSNIRKEHKKESKKNDSIPLLNLHKNSSSSKDSSQNKNRYNVKDAIDDDDALFEVQGKEEIVDDDEDDDEEEREVEKKKKEINTPERTMENNFKKEDSKRKSMKIALHLKDVFRSKKSLEEKSSDTKVKNQVFKSKKFGFLQKSKKKLTDSLSSGTDKNDGPDREDEKKPLLFTSLLPPCVLAYCLHIVPVLDI